MEPNTEPIQVPAEQNFEPTKKSLPKWPLIIVGVILLATLLTGTYLLGKNQGVNPKPAASKTIVATPTVTPTPDPTADWKTFTATKYNFNIKYPSSLNAEEFLTPFYSVTFKKVGAAQGEFSTFDLLASPNTFVAKNPIAYDWLSADFVDSFVAMEPNDIQNISRVNTIITKFPDITVAGETGTVIDLKSMTDNNIQRRVIVRHNGNTYMFVNTSGDIPTFNTWLRSIKFTKEATQAKPKPTSSSSNLNSVLQNYTGDWTGFTNSSLDFDYPKEWIVVNNLIKGTKPNTTVYAVDTTGTLMNECMQQTTVENRNGTYLRRFTAVTSGAACETQDSNAREIWVVKSSDSYGPGMSFRYSATEETQALKIFDLIFSTFKFLN